MHQFNLIHILSSIFLTHAFIGIVIIFIGAMFIIDKKQTRTLTRILLWYFIPHILIIAFLLGLYHSIANGFKQNPIEVMNLKSLFAHLTD